MERRLSASSCRAFRPDEFDAVLQFPLEAGRIAHDDPRDDAPVEKLAGPFGATTLQIACHLGEALHLRMDCAAFAPGVPASQSCRPLTGSASRPCRGRSSPLPRSAVFQMRRPDRSRRQRPQRAPVTRRRAAGPQPASQLSGSRQRSIRMPSFLSRSRSAMKLWIQRPSFLIA